MFGLPSSSRPRRPPIPPSPNPNYSTSASASASASLRSAAAVAMGQCPSAPRYHHHRHPPRNPPPPSPPPADHAPPQPLPTPDDDAPAAEDHTADLPDDLLAVVFGLLGSADRKRCSLVCRRWLSVDAASRLRLALDARAPLHAALPGILARFPAVSKLALKCDRRAESVADPTLALLADRLGPALRRLKLRSIRLVTDDGVAALAAAATNLRKLSVGSCTFGAKGIEAVLRSCLHLEELSIKRLRGLAQSEPVAVSSLRLHSLCLKELYNGQCFSSLITNSPNLKTLKIIRCSGDWDPVLQDLSQDAMLAELHLEKLQVSDRGVSALSGLEVLYLAKAPEVTDVGLGKLATRSPRLRKLHVDGWKANRIGDRGLAAVAQKCAALQELVLIGVNLTSASLELIAANCPALERLALCGSDTFGDAEISCVAMKCAALRKLCIKACPVSDAGMDKLAQGCPRLVKDARSVDESGVLENAGSDTLPDDLDDRIGGPDLSCGSSGRPSGWKAQMGAFMSRSLSVSMFRRRQRGIFLLHSFKMSPYWDGN
uniref:Uncharacterized protein n=1 Tax=Oryza glumipatula TaxID=40148 RepID=A0A0E0AZH1_9ORYZ